MLMHPLPALLNNGVPVALCSDDPAVFGNMGLTFDFFQVRDIISVKLRMGPLTPKMSGTRCE